MCVFQWWGGPAVLCLCSGVVVGGPVVLVVFQIKDLTDVGRMRKLWSWSVLRNCGRIKNTNL